MKGLSIKTLQCGGLKNYESLTSRGEGRAVLSGRCGTAQSASLLLSRILGFSGRGNIP